MLGGGREQGNRFRQKRFTRFLDLVDQAGITGRAVRIIDIGGRVDYWQALAPFWQGRDFEITVVNLETTDNLDTPPYHVRHGNACALSGFADQSFDIAHSNSVIEHVGNWQNMKAMAQEVSRLAPRYFIQTPNLWFPLEAHYRYPYMQFLPEGVRAAMLLRKTRGYVQRQANWDDAMREVEGIRLLMKSQMQALFPDGRIEREKVVGLTKSLIAIR
jgi:hypothetical protein